MSKKATSLFPAIRSKMGDRWYYATTMTFADVARCIVPVDAIHERKSLKTWIQRQLRPERKEEISGYLLGQDQRFFNAIVVGIYGGDPEWFPVEVGESMNLRDVKLGEREANAFGLLRLSGNEEIFAIDGQHRVEGIRTAILRDEKLKDDELTVIFVSHKRNEAGRERTRRLFTTLNKFAKPVSPAELIALNDDDAFAIVTRRLIDDYPGLNSEFVPLAPTANIPSGNGMCITTVISLYELVRTVGVPLKTKRKAIEAGPPDWKLVNNIYAEVTAFWDALKKCVPQIREVMTSKPADKLAEQYRSLEGGHLLFRPAGLQAFAKATRVLVDRGNSIDAAVAKFAALPLELSETPWDGILWNTSTQTMIIKYKTLAINLLLHLAEEALIPDSYELLKIYRRVKEDNSLPLPSI